MIDLRFFQVVACAVVGAIIGDLAFDRLVGHDSVIVAVGASTGAIVAAIAGATSLLSRVCERDRPARAESNETK